MSILQHSAFGASFYNLPNTLIGTYVSPGIAIKTVCNQFQFRCKITQPENNIISVHDHKDGLIFCGMITPKQDAFDGRNDDLAKHFCTGFAEYELRWDDTDGESKYSILQAYYTNDNTNDNQRHTLDVTDIIQVNDGMFSYTPCSFIVAFHFVVNNGEIVTEERSFDQFSYDSKTNKYQLKEPIKLEEFPSACSYEIKFMTNDNEKSFFVHQVEFIGDVEGLIDDGELKEREGFIICDLTDMGMTTINPDSIDRIGYHGEQSLRSAIEVRSKIFNSEASEPTIAQLRWSDPYFVNNNKIVLRNGKLQNTGTEGGDPAPVRIVYDAAKYFAEDIPEDAEDYTLITKARSLVLHGGAALRNPTFVADKKRYYTGLVGDVDNDGLVSMGDASIMPLVGAKLGDHNYIEVKDLIADDVITEADYDLIYSNLQRQTSLGGGYVSIKISYSNKTNNIEKVWGPYYVYEEGDYHIDLESFDISQGKLYIDIYMNRPLEGYISPYISLIGIVTENQYSSKIKFGPNSVYQSIVSADMVDPITKRVKNPTYLHYSWDEERKEVKCNQKALTMNELPFALPYWYSFRDTPMEAQNIFALTVNGNFALKNPHAKIYLDINLVGNQEIYAGGNINRGVNTHPLSVEGECLSDEYSADKKRVHIDANYKHMTAEFVCLLEADQASFEVEGICWSDDIENPSYTDISFELMQNHLSREKEYIYVIEVIGPQTLDSEETLVKLVRRNDAGQYEEVDRVYIDDSSNEIFYYQKLESKFRKFITMAKHYAGILNVGDTRGEYKRTIFAHEIPCLNKNSLAVECSNVSKAENAMRGKLYLEAEQNIQDLLKMEFSFDKIESEGKTTYELLAITISIDQPPVKTERAKEIETLVAHQGELNLREGSYKKISYQELSQQFGAEISADTVLSVENLSDNTQLIFTYDDDGIILEGRELYNFREDWIPKIKNGCFYINGTEYVYNSTTEEMKVLATHESSNKINVVDSIFGKAAIFNRISKNLMPTVSSEEISKSVDDFSYTILKIN